MADQPTEPLIRDRRPIGAERAHAPTYLRLRLTAAAASGGGGRARSRNGALAPRLRRVLGKALVELFCPFGRPLCEERGPASDLAAPRRESAVERCAVALSCPYGVLFAESLTARPPFALFVPDHPNLEGVSFELTLYGPATRLYGWALRALARALDTGLGPTRRRFSVNSIERVAPSGALVTLCGPELAALAADLAPDLLAMRLEPFLAPAPVTLELLSPTRFKADQRLLRRGPVPFEVVVARVLDRYRDLYGEASELLLPDIRRTVLDEAAQVPLLVDGTGWVEVRDYSAAKGQEMLLGGLVGRLLYGPGAVRFYPILRLAEILHVGKNAASGCGRLRVLLGEDGP